jgi:hypothetical protein
MTDKDLGEKTTRHGKIVITRIASDHDLGS